MKPYISIIIPVYNTEKYLQKCIESVLKQNDVKTEIILIDDGSTDRCPKICDIYADQYDNIIVYHTKNMGVSHARNTGLDHAKGDYIAFLDSDDEMIPNSLFPLWDFLNKYNADISVGKKRMITDSGNIINFKYPRPEEIWYGKTGLEQSLKDHPATYSVWGKIYKSTIIKDVRFKEDKSTHEDSFFIFLCMLKQPTVVVKDYDVINYNISENSASRSMFSKKFFDILYFAELKDKIIREKYPEFIYLTENLLIKAHLALLNNLSKTKNKQYKKHEKESLKFVKKHKKGLILATENDKKFAFIVLHSLYYPRKYIKQFLKGVKS